MCREILILFALVALTCARPLDIASDDVTAVVSNIQASSDDAGASNNGAKLKLTSRESTDLPPQAPTPVDIAEAQAANAAQPHTAEQQNIGAKAMTEVSHPELKTPVSPMMDLVVVIPTVRRFQSDGTPAPEQYLKPLVEKLWNDMNQEEQSHVKFFILNSDKEPEKHTEVVQLSQHPGVTVFNKVENKQSLLSSLSGLATLEDGREVSENWLSWVASENIDGAFLFEKARPEAPYILFLEDDVRPTTNALRKLTDFMREFEPTHNDWLFMDLYTPNLDWAPGMLDATNGERYNFQCCTQAMLFRSDRITGVINYWREHPSEPVDDNLRNYLRDVVYDLSVYAVVPNLFEHVGAYSSNKDKSTGIVEHTSLSFLPLMIQKEVK